MDRAEMRAGDGDREAVTARLKEALDDGRLDLYEYDERLQKALAARTYADLEGLTADLPGTVVPVEERPVVRAEEQRSPAPWLKGYAGVVAVCVLIWAISSFAAGELIYFWPVWMLIPLIFGFISNSNRKRGKGN